MKSSRILFCLFALVLCAARSFAADAAPSFDAGVLRERLAADLAAHYSLSDPLEVALLRAWDAPAGEGPVAVEIADYPETLSSSMVVRVRYLRDKAVLREDTLSLRVSLWRDALFAATPVQRGDAVESAAVEIRRVDALRDREAAPADVVGRDYVFARAIPAGRALTWRDISRRALVQKGRMVEVVAVDGALVVSMKALALQDGASGDTVRVRNVESKREFVAKVVSENRAEVRF